MTLWRLEILRLLRTKRLLILLAVYGFFGVTGPLTARYIREIIQRFGQGMNIEMPTPTPPDGITQFTSNAGQLGLLAVVIVAAGALAVDAHPEIAAFLRTRVRSTAQLLLPRYVVSAVAAIVALVVGTGLAWGLTAALIGNPDSTGVIVGTLLGALYLLFAVAVTAAMASVSGSVLTTVLWSVMTLIAFPVVGIIGVVRPWLPSQLLGAIDALVRGASVGDYWQSALVAAVSIVALFALAVRRTGLREI